MKKEYNIPVCELMELQMQGNILDVSKGKQVNEKPDHSGKW